MKFKQWIKDITKNTICKNKRFVISIIYLALVSLFLIHDVLYTSFDNEEYLITSLIVGALISLWMTLYLERKSVKNSILINVITSILASVGLFIYLTFNSSRHYYYLLTYFGVVVFLLALILFELYHQSESEKMFAYLFSKLIYSWILSITLLIGLFICVAAFDFLIIHNQDVYKLYAIIAIICEIFILGCLFLSYIPNGEKLTVLRSYENVAHKVALTLYYILIVILYIYLLKVIITFNMPVGKINWFASFALLFYCIFYLSTLYDEKVLSKFHKKFGGIVMLPIFLMQSYAIYVRVSAYGLTFWRYTSIIFNIIALAFFISSLIKYDRRWVFIFISIIILVVTISPLNLIDVPVYEQENRAKKVMVANGMYVNDKIVSNSDISSEDKEVIREAYLYVRYSNSDKSKLFKDIDSESFEKTFGFTMERDEIDDTIEFIYCYYYREMGESFDIVDYSQLTPVKEYESTDQGINDYCRDLYNKYGKELPEDLYYITENGDRLIFESLSFNYDELNDEIVDIYYEGLLLGK